MKHSPFIPQNEECELWTDKTEVLMVFHLFQRWQGVITNLHRILPSKENPGSNEVSAFSPHRELQWEQDFTFAVKSEEVFLSLFCPH